MTEEEIRQSIKYDVGVSDEFIDKHCKLLGITIEQYRKNVDRSLIARGLLKIDEQGNRTIIKRETLREQFKDILNK